MAEELKQEEEVQPVAESTPEAEVTAPVQGEAVVEKSEFDAIAKRLDAAEQANEALRKDLALQKLGDEPICKDVGIDAEVVYSLRKAAPEQAKTYEDKVIELHKQLTESLRELGTSAAPDVQETGLMAEAHKVQKTEGITEAEAIAKVAAANPDLYADYVRERQDATA